MFDSISPKRNKFAPSFPMRSKHFIKRYNYKRSSILDAIEHFKHQLTKLDCKSKKSPVLPKEPEKSHKSINFIELTLSFNQNTPNLSQHSIVSTLPTKSSLPPLRTHPKRQELKEIDDLICLTKRPAFLQRESNRRKMSNSKSQKAKQIVPDSSKMLGPKIGRKKIVISNKYFFDSSSESSSSIVMDPTLLD